MVSGFQYKAFISYSHKDRKIASWLLKKLETYRLPTAVRAQSKDHFSSQKSGLGSFFRDRENLSAGDHIEGSIFAALSRSEYLIVVCSPNSATSLRVDAEVREFIRARDSQNVLCVIVDGEPGISRVIGGNTNLECFSPALLHLFLTHDPLAADIRPIRDGKRLALSKLIAGLTSNDLTVLLRREQSRRHFKMTAAASLFGAVVISLVGFGYRAKVAEDMAIKARIEAELQTERSEGFAEYMIDEMIANQLREAGRIDALDSAIQKVVSYYSDMPDSSLSADSLSRKARAFSYLGSAYMRQDMPVDAKRMLSYARDTANELVSRNPTSNDAAFAHITALESWGRYLVQIGDLGSAEPIFRERLEFTETFVSNNPAEYNVMDNYASQHVHLGSVLMRMGEVNEAAKYFEAGLAARQAMLQRYPGSETWLNNLAGAYHHLAWAQSHQGHHDLAVANEYKSNTLYASLYEADLTDQRDRRNLARSHRWLAEALYLGGRFKEARDVIDKSIAMHTAIVDDDPDDENRWYQSCASSVVLAEVTIETDKQFRSVDLEKLPCPSDRGILDKGHIKATHRLLYYRLQLAVIEQAYQLEQYRRAMEDAENLKGLLLQEINSRDAAYPEIQMLQVGLRWLDIRLKHKQNASLPGDYVFDLTLPSDVRRHPRTVQLMKKIDDFQQHLGVTHMSR